MARYLPLFLTLLALPVLLAASCGGISKPDDALETPYDILAAVDAHVHAAQDVRILAKGDYYDPNATPPRVVGRPVTLLAQHPASVRIQIGSGYGNVLGALASDGTDVTMLDLQNNVFYYGPATPKNLSAILPLYLPGDDLVRVLHGGFPTSGLEPDWRDRAELSWNQETGRYRLELPRQGEGTQIVELTHPELGVAEVRIRDAEGDELYTYIAKDFSVHGGIPFPAKSRFELPAKDIDLTLYVEKVEFNPGLRARLFSIQQPAGTQSVFLGGGAPEGANVIATP